MATTNKDQLLFRSDDGTVKKMLTEIEGISFKTSPMDFSFC